MAEVQRKHRHGILAPFAFLGNLGGFIFPVGAVLLLSVPGILLYQGSRWLSTGTWPSISLADGLRWANIPQLRLSWGGLQLATEKFMQFPLALVLLALIVGTMSFYAEFSQWLEKRSGDAPGVEDEAVG